MSNINDFNPQYNYTSPGNVINPYREFTYTIAAGGIERIYYNFDYFRVITLTATNNNLVFVRFGEAGSESNIAGAGIGYKLPGVVNSCFIRNTNASSITVTVALAVGWINDDRLNVSGAITIDNTVTNPIYVDNAASIFNLLDDVALNSSTATQVFAGYGQAKEAIISSMATGGEIIYLGDSTVNNTTKRGIKLAQGQTAVIACKSITGGLYAISDSGTPSVGVSWTQYY